MAGGDDGASGNPVLLAVSSVILGLIAGFVFGFIIGYFAGEHDGSVDTVPTTTTVVTTTTEQAKAPCRRPTGPVDYQALDAMTKAGLTSDDIINLFWSACS